MYKNNKLFLQIELFVANLPTINQHFAITFLYPSNTKAANYNMAFYPVYFKKTVTVDVHPTARISPMPEINILKFFFP